MLVVKGMLIVSYKLENITQVKLDKVMELVDNLHMMYIFMFAVRLLLYSQKNNEFH